MNILGVLSMVILYYQNWLKFNQKSLLLNLVLCLFVHKVDVTEVHTDISSMSLAGMLFQGLIEQDLKTVYCSNKKIIEPESNYLVTEAWIMYNIY